MATYQTVTSDDKIDVLPHLERARQSLRAAAQLHGAEFPHDSVSRSHQACIHAERALLATEKRSPQDVHGVHRMATLHFLQAGQLAPEHLANVERLAVLRSRADDLPAGRVTAGDSADGLESAAAFLDAAERWLAAKGYLKETRP